MLITNTPNSELHVYNNDGKEIVHIDESGVVEPKGSTGLYLEATFVDSDNYEVDFTFPKVFSTQEEAWAAAKDFCKDIDFVEVHVTNQERRFRVWRSFSTDDGANNMYSAFGVFLVPIVSTCNMTAKKVDDGWTPYFSFGVMILGGD